MRKCDDNLELAERHCNRDCLWYHGNWELLKSLGVVTTSGVHALELTDLLEVAIGNQMHDPRVLLSGSTDDSLLRILAPVFGKHGGDITALDICATPLELMRRYASEIGLELTSIKSDILDFSPEDSFDLIFTHAFMGNFDESGRTQLVRKWASLLNEGGRVVTVQRVRPTDSPPVIRFSAGQATDFIRASIRAAEQSGQNNENDLTRIEAAATLFTDRFMSYSITSKEALEKLFTDAGLRFLHLEYKALAQLERLTGPSVPSGGEYAFIIAERV